MQEISEISGVQKFTLSLDTDTTARIKRLVEPYRGTVPGYAAAWAEILSLLPVPEQEALRAQINTRIMQLQAAGLLAAPKIPAVPPQITSELKTLLAQVEQPPQPARKRRSRPGKQNGTNEAPPAADEPPVSP